MSEMPMCPSCGIKLKKTPKRTAKCSSCGNRIYIRKNYNVYPSVYLNEDQAEVYDALEVLGHQGVTLKKFIREKEKLTSNFLSRGFSAPLDFDVIWSIYTKLTQKYAKVSDSDQLSGIYFLMARHIKLHNQDNFDMLRRAQECRLKYIESLFKKDVIVAIEALQKDSCKVCRESDGLQIKLSQALKEMPLPHKAGICEVDCCCMYYAVSGW